MRWRQCDGAPAPGTPLCRADAIGDNQARNFIFGSGGERFEMFVARAANGLFAYVNECPHTGTTLDFLPNRFFTQDKKLLLCSTHGARFRINDGACVAGPCVGRGLIAVPVEVVVGEIRIAQDHGG
jgi:nitrite reductase/ring-hydroxylating ferredoxin subunit